MARRINAIGSVAFLDSFQHGLHPGWRQIQDSLHSTPRYRSRHLDGSLHLDGSRVATNNPIKAGLRKDTRKIRQSVTWLSLHFDFRVASIIPAETNIHIEIEDSASNTVLLQKKIFSGDDKISLHKYPKSTPIDSEWQTTMIDLSVSDKLKTLIGPRITIFTLQNAFRPLKTLSIRNVFAIRTALDNELHHHLPDGHAKKVVPPR